MSHLRATARLLALAGGVAAMVPVRAGEAVFFDDFSDDAALRSQGWQVRQTPGHPGVPGARWASTGVRVVVDPQAPGNRLLRLSAQTDGTPEGTHQAQVCHARKVLHGTYAARVRFSDAPISGQDGDPVIQTFYTVSPLRHDFDPEFSEVDWEYLPNGGWGSEQTRLYGLSWQTVRVDPWQAHNSVHAQAGSFEGWHTLVMQVSPQGVRMLVDGRPFATHAGRNIPVVPMAIQFNLWFSPTGLLPPSALPRQWQQDIDWVYHAANRQLSPDEVLRAVNELRGRGMTQHDGIAPLQPPLDSPCSF